MPLEPYHMVTLPADETLIWKYFPRRFFDDLVKSEALFFRRVIDYLNDDPNEGTIPKAEAKNSERNALWRYMRDPRSSFESLSNELKAMTDPDGFGMRHATVINCWTMRPTESRLMWQAYAGVDRTSHGVAVRSTVGMLRKALQLQSALVEAASVEYIDYENGRFKYRSKNTMVPLWHKNKHGYADELELRLFHSHREGGAYRNEDLWDEYPGFRATKIKVDLAELMAEVVLSPNATDNDMEEVKDLCRSKGVFASTHFRHSRLHPMSFRFDITPADKG